MASHGVLVQLLLTPRCLKFRFKAYCSLERRNKFSRQGAEVGNRYYRYDLANVDTPRTQPNKLGS